jgi:Nucleotidyl transferase AbiEii toxin, Type IV TA system
MMTSTAGFPSAQAFRRSLNDRIRERAKVGARNTQQLHREFLLQRFLARVFAAPGGSWILKGGTGLLVRIPGARHSKDVDLLNPEALALDAVDELRALAAISIGDPFTFVLGTPTEMTGAAGLRVPVEAFLEATRIDGFTVDLSIDRHPVSRLERVHPHPVVEMPGLAVLPEFVLYPLPDQVADKVCAIYERHGDRQLPSTRFRDLLDLVLITMNLSLDAALTTTALASETARRGLALPDRMSVPGPEWELGYRAIARANSMDPALCDLTMALARTGSCLDPLLGHRIRTGTWNHFRGIWEPRRAD